MPYVSIYRMRRLIMVAVLAWGSASAAYADEWTIPVNHVIDGRNMPAQWSPLPTGKITKRWKLCVLFPHLKDPYWMAGDYGIVQEVLRDNLNMQLFHAEGYEHLDQQLAQMSDCIDQRYDAIILGAIHSDKVAPLVRKAVEKGIPVIDFVNGVNEPQVSAHALVSFYDLAFQTAQYIVKRFDKDQPKIGFFPGLPGSNWSDDAVRGFNDGLKGSNARIVVTTRVDTGLSRQLAAINDALKAYPDMNFIVGVDIAAQAAATAVRTAHKSDSIKILAFDMIPGVHQDIMNGVSEASPADFPVMQARMAVDMAVRLLEKQTLPAKKAGPVPQMFTKESAAKFSWNTMFAPRDFKEVYTVKAR
ncbi:TMAO reductase system periplasmic protein TorT [Herbaspirillum sp. RV1423]|uniref:TMAO reductase system periplasmic protein TorT n=1 Tax=Herbaspirillum sp. RV1423 TaxID=1443993 RepID=UPI0004AEE2F1|nr:TMAO reductase system periplasmic protein TorT [Herbaspirillum sp. RV1423]